MRIESARVDNAGFWCQRWRKQKTELESASGRSGPATFWTEQGNTNGFYQKSRSSDEWKKKVACQIASMNISPGSRVLDIGAGTGTLAVPLAALGCDVTAVEPSGPMLQGLVQARDSSGVNGITIVPKRWEDITEAELGDSFDAVIASYSLSMVDIRTALLKMHHVSRKYVHLFWFLSPPRWAIAGEELWEQLFGRRYSSEPLADCLWNVLYEMGIYANLSAEPEKPPTRYMTIDEAVDEFHRRFCCTSEKQDRILRTYFRKTLIRSGAGYELVGPSRGAHIWWDSGNGI